MLIREKPPMKNVTVIGFCVTSNDALPNSASNSLRLLQVPAKRLLFEPGGVSYLGARLRRFAAEQQEVTWSSRGVWSKRGKTQWVEETEPALVLMPVH